MEETKKVSKIAFFKELYQLDDADDEIEDTAAIGEILEKSTGVPSPQSNLSMQRAHAVGRAVVSGPAPGVKPITCRIPHTTSPDPTPANPTLPKNHVSVEKDVIPGSENSTEATTTKAPKAIKGKRKRGQSLDLLSESQDPMPGSEADKEATKKEPKAAKGKRRRGQSLDLLSGSQVPVPGSEADKEATKKAPKASKGKGKRGQSLELLPESQQVFKGLTFCTYKHSYLPIVSRGWMTHASKHMVLCCSYPSLFASSSFIYKTDFSPFFHFLHILIKSIRSRFPTPPFYIYLLEGF